MTIMSSPTPLVKGRIGEDLKLTGNYRWWVTHNTFNEQFYDVPGTPLADLRAGLPSLTQGGSGQLTTVSATISNVGGLTAANVSAAFAAVSGP